MTNTFSSALRDRLHRVGAVAVLVIDRETDAVPTARALWEGGVEVAEVTFRTKAAAEGLAKIAKELPEMLPVAGTVLSPDQVDLAVDSGAAMAVAPGLNRETLARAQERSLPFAPGILTPTEIETAVSLGCRELKFFPAGTAGGLPLLRSIAAPYQHLDLSFLPTGSIAEEAMGEYLAFRSTLAVGGSWIAPQTLIQNQDWAEITRRAIRARKIVETVRGKG